MKCKCGSETSPFERCKVCEQPMKRQIILMRVPNGILVDGPSLKSPRVYEEAYNVISWVRKELNYLIEVDPNAPFKVVEKTKPESKE